VRRRQDAAAVGKAGGMAIRGKEGPRQLEQRLPETEVKRREKRSSCAKSTGVKAAKCVRVKANGGCSWLDANPSPVSHCRTEATVQHICRIAKLTPPSPTSLPHPPKVEMNTRQLTSVC
jgi:hypothetical protein